MLLQKPKWGYISEKPGSWLEFTLRTLRTAPTTIEDPHTVVAISFMRSYERFGEASASSYPRQA